MGLSDFLSSALTVGTQAAGAHEAGLAQRGQMETQDLLQKIQLARQANQDAMAKQLQGAQIKNYESLAADRAKPDEETFGAPVPLTMNGQPGVYERGNRGTLRQVPGATPYKDTSALSETIRHNKAMEGLSGQRGKASNSAELEEAEGWWNTVIKSQGATETPEGRAAAAAFNAMRKAHPDWTPQRIMLSIMKATQARGRAIRQDEPEDEGAPPAPPQRPPGWSDEKWNQYLRDTGQTG